jgi:hypothetical protein
MNNKKIIEEIVRKIYNDGLAENQSRFNDRVNDLDQALTKAYNEGVERGKKSSMFELYEYFKERQKEHLKKGESK